MDIATHWYRLHHHHAAADSALSVPSKNVPNPEYRSVESDKQTRNSGWIDLPRAHTHTHTHTSADNGRAFLFPSCFLSGDDDMTAFPRRKVVTIGAEA